jgi:hypothetical protein
MNDVRCRITSNDLLFKGGFQARAMGRRGRERRVRGQGKTGGCLLSINFALRVADGVLLVQQAALGSRNGREGLQISLVPDEIPDASRLSPQKQASNSTGGERRGFLLFGRFPFFAKYLPG